MKNMRVLITIMFFLGLSGCLSKSSKPEVESEKIVSWSGTMRGLQKNLSALDEYIFDPVKFASPANHNFLQQQISEMAQQSKNLEHNPTMIHRDPTIRFVATQFSEDLARAKESFEEGKIPFARYQLMKVSGSCVQCHTRMQQGAEHRWKKEEPFLKSLTPAYQVEFLIASRRFDQAHQVLIENLKKTEGLAILDIERLAHLGLLVTVQYQNDPSKAQQLVGLIQKSSSASPLLVQEARGWIASIQAWGKEKKKPETLTDWRQVFETRKNEIGAMRAIHGVLQLMMIQSAHLEVGEALLLLGESYEALNGLMPMDLHENYYASCIQSVPHTPTAQKCFDHLSDSIRLGYSGSSGIHVPVEVEVWLESLKKKAL